jgi:LmbE family N-acetylglucosaminyl deacetylase
MTVVRRFTLVSFHAHPDDETLLTGGTLARAAAQGHRVVLVTATDGARGLAGREDGRGAALGRVRSAELQVAAEVLGCSRLVTLGYGDSGLDPDPHDSESFASADLLEAAERLADVLREEHADVLTVYDANGGYGHPDHVRVHAVGTLAARAAGTPVVLEATAPGGLFRAVLAGLRVLRLPLGTAPLDTRDVFSPGRAITHRIRVGAFAGRKREAMRAHASQRRAPDGTRHQIRALDLFVRLPLPLFRLVFGREWFVQQDRSPGRPLSDVFATVPTPEPLPAGGPTSSRTRPGHR